MASKTQRGNIQTELPALTWYFTQHRYALSRGPLWPLPWGSGSWVHAPELQWNIQNRCQEITHGICFIVKLIFFCLSQCSQNAFFPRHQSIKGRQNRIGQSHLPIPLSFHTLVLTAIFWTGSIAAFSWKKHHINTAEESGLVLWKPAAHLKIRKLDFS